MAEEEPQSLKALFQSAEAARESVTSSTPVANPDHADLLNRAIRLYESCLEHISRLSLFSPNEQAEDISTTDLPYLLISYYLADLLSRQTPPVPSPTARKAILTSSRHAYERFLHLIDTYNFLTASQSRLLERYTEDPRRFTTVPTNADGAARRKAKIANFKQEKELRQKLEYLISRPEYGTEDGGGDEELLRRVHLAHLSYAIHQTFQALESLNRELDVLDLAPDPSQPTNILTPQQAEDERHRLRQKDDYSDKQELAKGVFRPGHNLPTMSIDEYLEEERKRGGIIEGGGEASWARPEPNEDDIEKADQETYKARAWDEYVESNPKGSGNTLNRG
ncbi:hypothetical protein DL546_006431 [Coniochaeta pulveracea]|uniref:TOR signaling pathway regulator n=1 Tax=Coniochaeta pulveracea TaxID=177199 RepID=A0A420YFT0_9PEZI|nr:hypothetical protein DL546_006431 [Coniochaeta pulveracea]